MRPVALALLPLLLLSTGTSGFSEDISRPGGRALGFDAPVPAVPGELIVGLRHQPIHAKREARVAEIAEAFDLDVLPAAGLARLNAARLRVRGAASPADVAARLAALPDVAYAEPNVMFSPAAVPTDPLYAGVDNVPTDLQRWAFGGFGENRVLNAESAWDITTGSPSVVIAVIDSGLDTDNPEFRNLWVNSRETPGNGLDDDGNGYVDDVNGYDFVNRRGDINPDLGDGIDNDEIEGPDSTARHGTVVASIIGAAQNDGIGMAGAAPGCSLMTVKVFGDDGSVGLDRLIEAIMYAADNGAEVMNLSLVSRFNSSAMRDAMDYVAERKVVIVCAAGNGDSRAALFPASYGATISVGGSDGGFGVFGADLVNKRWPLSQYGPAAVDVVAPAKVLAASVVTVARANEDLTLVPGQTVYGIHEGTSFAAPFVSALAGLVISRDVEINGRRTLFSRDVKVLFSRAAVDLSERTDWDSYGRVDYAAALAAIPGASPPAPAVERATFHHRVLRVYGEGFSADSSIEVNGALLAEPIRFSYADDLLEIRGGFKKLNLRRKAENQIVVIERGVRSAVFTLQL